MAFHLAQHLYNIIFLVHHQYKNMLSLQSQCFAVYTGVQTFSVFEVILSLMD